MDKEDMEHKYNRILFSHNKEENPMFVTTWMNLEGFMLNEISQKENNKYCIVSLICGI